MFLFLRRTVSEGVTPPCIAKRYRAGEHEVSATFSSGNDAPRAYIEASQDDAAQRVQLMSVIHGML